MSQQDNQVRPVGNRETFCFSCGPHVPCFNECCRDLNQFLTPYDVLRLARHLKMDSRDFLKAYTNRHTGPDTGLPVVTLRASQDGQRCPFVSPKGCSVYENRPSSCRMYPLARMLRRSREDGRLEESYVLICEAHCRGFEYPRDVTPEQWISDQGLERYNELNDEMIGIISIKQRHLPGPLGKDISEKLFSCLYDVDSFKRNLSGQAAEECRKIGLCPEDLQIGDDGELVRFAVKYASGLLRHESGSARQG
ncbi:MAG: YkgJ family cysteine cluster protein [Desulfosalsimonas sp.]